jgi:hypothetical protein
MGEQLFNHNRSHFLFHQQGFGFWRLVCMQTRQNEIVHPKCTDGLEKLTALDIL